VPDGTGTQCRRWYRYRPAHAINKKDTSMGTGNEASWDIGEKIFFEAITHVYKPRLQQLT